MISAGGTKRTRPAGLAMCVDRVAKVLSRHGSKILRALGATIEQGCGGPASSCAKLTGDFPSGFDALLKWRRLCRQRQVGI